MSINTMRAEVRDTVGGTPIQGYSWPVTAFPYEELLASVYPGNMVSWAQPGRIPAVSGDTISVKDACNLSQIWAKNVGNTSTLQRSPAVMSNLPRWQSTSAVVGETGILGSLPAQLTDYTFACLVKVSTLIGGHNTFMSVGDFAPSRIWFYMSSSHVLTISHGSGDVHVVPGPYNVADVWYPLIVSYRDADKNLQIFNDGPVAIYNTTMVARPPVERSASVMMATNGGSPMIGEFALGMIWNTPLHNDATAISNVMTGLQGLRGL